MEQKFISWLEKQLSNESKSSMTSNVILGIGDDGAILGNHSTLRVIVADAIVDKVHFHAQEHDLGSIGHKALAVNLSDIAAMGAIPEAAIVTLALPRQMTFGEAQRLFSGLANTAKRYGVAVVGGDTTRHDGPLMLSVTVTGYLQPHFYSREGWRMDGAKVGDLLFTTGPLGGSIAGKHLVFDPRLQFAKAVQERVVVNAATDISDSLAIDLSHLLRKCGLGAVLDLDRIPVSEAAQELSKESEKTALEHALYDGEDFELLLSMNPSQAELLRSDADFKFELYEIGSITSEHPGEILASESKEVVEVRGYEH